MAFLIQYAWTRIKAVMANPIKTVTNHINLLLMATKILVYQFVRKLFNNL